MDTAANAAGAGLEDALRQYAAHRFSGLLLVTGQPGGTVYLADGDISGCETPGAPSLEVILLRSLRVSEADWNAAFTAAAVAGRPLTAELVGQGLLGAGETEALLRTALADAMFAVLSGTVDGWTEATAADCPLPLTPPAKPGWLLAENTRRGQALAGFTGPLISGRDRVTAVPGAERAGRRGPGPGQGEILALANGRRTIRDLAFALGCGLYETMLEMSRMRAANLVEITAYGTKSASRDGPAGIASDRGGSDQTAAGLPRRRTDRTGRAGTGEPGRRDLAAGVQLLRPRPAGSTGAG
jgi:hypothetical protein